MCVYQYVLTLMLPMMRDWGIVARMKHIEVLNPGYLLHYHYSTCTMIYACKTQARGAHRSWLRDVGDVHFTLE